MTQPTIVPKIKPYLTIIQTRSPVEKLHTSLGHAKNALTYSSGNQGTIWEWVEGEWKLLFTVTATRVQGSKSYYDRFVQDIPWRNK